MDYESAEEAARRWGVSARWVQALCRGQRIAGARRLGRVWLIPRGAEKPGDRRLSPRRHRTRLRKKQ